MTQEFTKTIAGDILAGLEALVAYAAKWTRPDTRHAGGAPIPARKISAALFYLPILLDSNLTGVQQKQAEALRAKASELAAQCGVTVDGSPADTLLASGHRISEPASLWVRQAYR